MQIELPLDLKAAYQEYSFSVADAEEVEAMLWDMYTNAATNDDFNASGTMRAEMCLLYRKTAELIYVLEKWYNENNATENNHE